MAVPACLACGQPAHVSDFGCDCCPSCNHPASDEHRAQAAAEAIKVYGFDLTDDERAAKIRNRHGRAE